MARKRLLFSVGYAYFEPKWPYLEMNEPNQTAHQIKADDEVNSNIYKKLAKISPDWPKLAEMTKIGQNWML